VSQVPLWIATCLDCDWFAKFESAEEAEVATCPHGHPNVYVYGIGENDKVRERDAGHDLPRG